MSLTRERAEDIRASDYAHEIPPVMALCEDWIALRKRAEEAERERDALRKICKKEYVAQLGAVGVELVIATKRIAELEAKLAGMKQGWRIAWTWGSGRKEDDHTTAASNRECLLSTWDSQAKTPETFRGMRWQARDVYAGDWEDVEPK